jgi:AmpD protein
MIVYNGWLENVKHCRSPNYNQRPLNSEIELLVIHSISLPPGQYGNSCIDDFFCNQLSADSHPYFQEISNLNVSSHLLINRKGKLTQYVSFLDRAWHAGESNYKGKQNCNDFSIGIELEGLEGETFEAIQYQSLAEVCQVLLSEYPSLNKKNICGHSDIAPGRKQDPGEGFDWAFFFESLDC